MKNSITDLSNHLFVALERLNDESLDPEQIQQEVARAKAVSDVSDKIIDVAKLSLDAVKFQTECLDANTKLPEMFNTRRPTGLLGEKNA